ncbi:MAG: bifunctional diaminohydroxyphosphoribosylaminopyrimidine deaminase/5-amino-6-(5-phosphoribosylamino)uracil reductase RibD [Clostridiales Family XIII bacterium]|nr:bifunctional diaminohydroxyphosphoribosylaminopyrimidine deaminase/5-amino-6-(5-phosphoribosylamino)uracil reductase RibD [Clostridiales Family XIII bacterium]
MNNDIKHMKRAIKLAFLGRGRTKTNPMVGAVIVKDEKIIGEGYHENYGGPHAEINALNSITSIDEAKDSTLYVTLEPCNHEGKTPPCTEAIINAGIRKVVIGMLDPHDIVSGAGVKRLTDAGIEVVVGIDNEEISHSLTNLYESYIVNITSSMPFVTMKFAMTTDGKIATYTGDSKWITGNEARKDVHLQRSMHDAVLVGIGTVIADDPMLNVRLERSDYPPHMIAAGSKFKNPTRVIVDSQLSIRVDSNILKTAKDIDTIIATASDDEEYIESIKAMGANVIVCAGGINHNNNDKVNLQKLFKELYNRNIATVYVEGGGNINFSSLRDGLVHRLHAYIGPKIFGGAAAPSPVEGPGVQEVKDCYELKLRTMQTFADDVKIEYDVRYK